MNNKKNYDILKKSFDVSSDSVVNLKARVNIDNKKKSDFSDKQDKDTQEFKTEASMIKNLENTTKNISKRNISKDDNNSANVKSNYFLRYFFYFLVFFLPLFFLPFSMEIFEFNKTLLLFVVSSLAFLVWMVKMIIIDRRIVFVKTPLDVPIIIFIFLVLLSTVLSVDKVSSVLGFYGRFSDSLMVYLSLAMLYFVGVNSVVFRQVQDDNQQICDDSKNFTNNLIKTFLASSFVVIIVSLLYSLGIKLIPLNETQFNSFNLVSGSFNILGIYLVSVIIIAFYYLLENKNALVKCLVYLLITMSLILLAIIDFVVAWVVLAVSLLLALILSFIVRRHGENAVSARHCLVPAGLIILISFAFIATSLTCMNNNIESNFKSSSMSSSIKDRIAPSVDNGQIEDGKRFIKEVILDKETAIYITVEGIKEDPIIGIVGTGPGTYLYNFSKFKPVEFNNNIYWNIRFDKAGSEIIEKISTIGILGVLSYLLIMVLVVGMFLKALRKVRNNNFIYLFSAWFSLLLFQFLYIESMTTKFVFWMLTIILVVKCYSFRTQDAEENILWEFKIRRSNCIFYLSLLLVIIASITISY
ncbi:MAG: hypothetical protein U9P70_01340, partial [Patescibacteria group bacterium]|nr:hypothetical protein [Patescibacteria group bacterium]